jgi:excisionase family DNA binding protein
MIDKKDKLTTKEAAELLGLHPYTLSNWRSRGKYKLKYLKIGGRVYYRLTDLNAWLKSRERTQVEG